MPKSLCLHTPSVGIMGMYCHSVSGGGGARTQSFRLARQALYLLSYISSPAGRFLFVFSFGSPYLLQSCVSVFFLFFFFLQVSLSELQLSRDVLFLLVNPVVSTHLAL